MSGPVSVRVLVAAWLVVGTAAAAAAAPQVAAEGSTFAERRLQQRYQVGVMERVLEQAVQHGAQMTSRTISSLSPSLWLFTGPVRARGIVLEGYGLFVDVEVPALRRSLAWSLQTLDQRGLGIARAMESLRTHVASLPDRSARTALEQALQRIELQVGPPGGAAAGSGDTITSDGGGGSITPSDPDPPMDPGEAYTGHVRAALIDAMLDHGAPIGLADQEWLTVAARDSQERLGPPDPNDILTLVLRIRGEHLRQFRAGELSRAEAEARVEAGDF